MHGFLNPRGFVCALWEAQEGKCFHCGLPMIFLKTPNAPKNLYATREHVYPRANGGRNLLRNVVLAHAQCNNERGCQMPTEDQLGRARAIYAKIGVVPFEKPNDGGEPNFTAHRERVLKSWQTFTAPKLKDIWPHE